IVKRAVRKSKRKASRARAAPKSAKMYRTNMREVRKVAGLKRKDGWVDMQVQFLIDKASAGADHVIGWTVLKPGARHERHRHHHCDEFFIVLKGHGHIYTDDGETPSGEGDVVYSPRKCRLDRGLRLRGRSGQSLISAPRSARLTEGVMNLWEDARVIRGMRAQLELRRKRLAAG